MHKCSLCTYSSMFLGRYNQHLKIHSSEKSFFCSHPNCNFSTKYKESLISHTRRIHTGEKPWVCQFESCSYAATRSNDLVRHTRSHTKEKPYKCPEANCTFSAASRCLVKRHQLTHEPKEGEKHPSFKCPLCEYSSKTRGNLSTHIKWHTLEKLFKCEEPNCNFEARTKSEITMHKTVHSNEKPFVCPVESCEHRCRRKSHLSSHLKTHSEEKRYKCELCPYRAKTRDCVNGHLNLVHSNIRPFKCTVPDCCRAFKLKQSLNGHLLTHNGTKKYACSIPNCDYRSIRKSKIKSHISSIHSVERNFKCGLCDAAFKLKCNLTAHFRTHTKEMPYSCKETKGPNPCEFKSASSSSLKRHIRVMHSKM